MTEIADSPTWDELDAIAKGKSAMDLAEEIWRLRRSNGPSRPLAETLMAAAAVLSAKDEGWDEAIEAAAQEILNLKRSPAAKDAKP